ncbi:serine/threonine-protein kinase [Miltoncostaea marina]|uniref:serine/threonine-protein kinase n=1 Tax=Miltoncostaea marina TaxID=2843215 RepID=UPI001C3C4564|nr:serine/threonine-protein kinase [Miltoncostaea marina]
MSDEPSHDPGALPARYRDPVLIATGGMGSVHRAHDDRLGRTVAVKVQSPALAADPAFRRRFRREATAAARIHHPHVATVYDVGTHEGLPYLVMEFVPGGTLGERMARGRPPRAQALRWIAQTADALDAAHAAGVVHRDVKPANLLLDARERVKVVDFGIARVLEDTGGTLTAAGTVLGSSGYASPEQAQGLPATAASDVYSLAAVAFELLAGEPPYAGRTGIAALWAHVHEPPPDAAARAPELPPAVAAVLARGLAKDPADRHPSAGALADDLAAACAARTGEPTAVMPPPPSTAARGGAARPRRGAAVAAVAAVVAVAAGAGAAVIATTGGDGDRPAQRPAAAATVVRTAVAPPRTVVETVTEAAAPSPAPAPAPDAAGAPAPGPADAVALTDRSTAALEDGDAAGGLALAEQALRGLAGSGDPYEGNASYNAGRALIDLGRCDEAVPRLERAVAVGGSDWQMGVRRAALREARAC